MTLLKKETWSEIHQVPETVAAPLSPSLRTTRAPKGRNSTLP